MQTGAYRRAAWWAATLALVAGLVAAGVTFYPDPTPGPQPSATVLTALDPQQAELSAEKKRQIWDVEQAAFQLERRFGAAFTKAHLARDADALRSHLREGFVGWLPVEGQQQTRRHGAITETRWSAAGASLRQVDARQFAQELPAWTRDFEPAASSHIRVLQLHRDPAAAGLWHARLLLTVASDAAAQQPAIVESEHEVDFRVSDLFKLDAEPVVESWRMVSRSARRSEQVLLLEVTETSGLSGVPLPDNWRLPSSRAQQYWSQMAVEDFDRDGDPDIAVAVFLGQPYLLRCEEGPRFEDVTKAMGLRPWQFIAGRSTNLVAWIDFDNDGFADLLLGDRLYRNHQGRYFTDVTSTSGLRFQTAMGAVVTDYDCDGLLDLYLLYQHAPQRLQTDRAEPWIGDTESGGPNALWRNEGGGRFREVTAESQADGGRRKSFAAAWHFYDQDRYPDLYIANDFGNNVHLRNRGDGTFEDISALTGMQDFATSMGVAAGDIDNDGSPEIYVANMYSKMGRRIIGQLSADDYPAGIFEQIEGSCAGNRLYKRTSPAADQCVEVSAGYGVNPVGWAYAPAMVDLDADGWLDIYATTGFLSFERGKPDG